MTSRCVADVEGPWKGPEVGTSLTNACQRYWDVPVSKLPNGVLAMFIRQRIGLRLVIDEAQERVQNGVEDGSELYEEELEDALAKSREA